MNPLIATVLNLGLRALTHKAKEETIEEKVYRKNEGKPVPVEFSAKKLLATVPVWSIVGIAIVTVLSSMGYIDPKIAEAILNVLLMV